jgi:hypothetical protein
METTTASIYVGSMKEGRATHPSSTHRVRVPAHCIVPPS